MSGLSLLSAGGMGGSQGTQAEKGTTPLVPQEKSMVSTEGVESVKVIFTFPLKNLISVNVFIIIIGIYIALTIHTAIYIIYIGKKHSPQSPPQRAYNLRFHILV